MSTKKYPNLILLDDCNNDWDEYIENVYQIFKKNFIDNPPKLSMDNSIITIRRKPLSKGKELTFWHITSTGKVEEERIPDMRRCEHIRFPRFLIENFSSPLVYAWEKEVKRRKRVHLSNKDYSYLTVISDYRRGKRGLVTSFFVEMAYQRKKYQNDHLKYAVKSRR